MDYETPLYDILDGLNRMVKAGKVRYIGISNCFAYQLAKANALAEKKGLRNSSRSRATTPDLPGGGAGDGETLREDHIAMTPYSALAGGRLSKHPGETSSGWRRTATRSSSTTPPPGRTR